MNRTNQSNRNGESSRGTAYHRRIGTGRVAVNYGTGQVYNHDYNRKNETKSHRNDRNERRGEYTQDRNGQQFKSK